MTYAIHFENLIDPQMNVELEKIFNVVNWKY